MTCDCVLHNLPLQLHVAHDRIISALQADTNLASGTAIEQLCFLIFLKILDEEAQNNTATNLFPAQAERFSWSRWRGKPAAELRDFLRDDVFPYMSSLVREDLQVADYYRDAMLEIVVPDALKQIVDELDKIEFTKLQSIDTGHFFEALLNKLENSSDTGYFRTPQIMREIMIALVNPKAGDMINDMACGTGGLLVEAIKIKSPLINGNVGGFAFNPTNQIPPTPPLSRGELLISGADISHQMVRIAAMNLMLHGIRHPKITRANTLATTGGLSEDELNRKYSIVLCNPPMGMQVPRGFLRHGLPTDARKSELLFTWLAMESLEISGRAAVILPEAALLSTNTANKELRKKLVEDFDLLTVITLPSNCLKLASAIKSAIVVFQRPSVGGVARIDRTFFCELDDGLLNLTEESRIKVITKLLNFLKSHLDTGFEDGALSNLDGITCSLATQTTIAENGYNLAPSQYKPKSSSVHTLKPAPTLKDLRDRIDEAIEIAGEDATWNGFDDEAIYIYHPTDRSKWVAILPRDEKQP